MKIIKSAIYILLIITNIFFISYFINDKIQEKKYQDDLRKKIELSNEKCLYYDAAGSYAKVYSNGELKVFSIDSKELKTRLAYYKKRFNIDISAEDYEGYIDELDKKDEIPENEEFREFVNRMEELGVSSGECIEYEDFKLEYNKS